MEENKNDILTAEDAKEIAPFYTDVIKALKQVYDPEIPVLQAWNPALTKPFRCTGFCRPDWSLIPNRLLWIR